jgi:hypothetical protein
LIGSRTGAVDSINSIHAGLSSGPRNWDLPEISKATGISQEKL